MKLFIEQLEDRLVPASLVWFPSEETLNWNDNNNWINPDTGLAPNVSPTISDDVFFILDSSDCHLNSDVQVKSLTIQPTSDFTLYIHNNTLRVEGGGFEFYNGIILAESSGRTIINSCNTAEWENEAGFIGGSVELRHGTLLDIPDSGTKPCETTFIIGNSHDSAHSVLDVTGSGSIDLGLSGQIYVSNLGILFLENEGNFHIQATEENPYPLDLDGELNQVGEGITNIHVGILMLAPSSDLVVSHGGLIIDDVNDNLSVQMDDGTIYLKPGSFLNVLDDLIMTGGYFTLAGLGLNQTKDIITTYGNFYFEDGYVSLIQNLSSLRGIEWKSYAGQVVFGDGCTLTTNIANEQIETDQLIFDSVTLGGEWRLNQNSFIPPDNQYFLIKALNGQMYGDFAESTVNAEDLDAYFTVSFYLDNNGYRCKELISL